MKPIYLVISWSFNTESKNFRYERKKGTEVKRVKELHIENL